MDKNSLHFRGTYRNVYEVNRAYPNGGVDGDYVDINGWQHWWNPDRGTWCVNENRDSYWDEVLSTVQNLLFSKPCVSESDFPLNPTDEEKRFGYFYNGELYLWTGTNGTVRNGQYRSFGVVQGERGVGVSSIAQTSTSNVDGGKNEITVTLTNGDSYKFFTYNGTGRNKGYYYRTLDELKQAVPSPTVTDWAIVDGSVYVCDEAGVWKDTTYSWKPIKLNPFVTELNKMDMPTSTGYLYWNGQSFGWKTPVVNNGGGNTGGGTSIDLSEYSWWGRKFAPASKMITGEMSAVTSIEFQSTKGETTIRKKLYLDENGDLCFNGNLYATGGITALGSGGGTSGGSGASLGTLLAKLNSENPFPTASGQVLTYDGSNFVWKTSTGSGGTSGGGSGGSLKPLEVVGKNGSDSTFFVYNGETAYRLRFGDGLNMVHDVDEYVVTATGSSGSGVTLSPVMTAMNNQLGKTTLNTPQFLYWTGSKYIWKNESEISGGSGSNSRINTIKLYNSGGEFDSVNLGSANTIGFMAGDNVTLEAIVKDYINVIKISAKGGSSTGGSVSWSDVTNKPSTFTPSSHTHSTNDISGLSSYVQGTKVSNAGTADRLSNAVTLWGNSFSGNNSIGTTSSYADLRYVKNIYADSTFDIEANNKSVLRTIGTGIHIGFGYMSNANASLVLFGNKTTIYTNNDNYSYDFKDNVFDVNTNTIHFGYAANGGKISWDANNKAFKIEGNVYATGGITALGVSNSATTSNNVDFTFKSVTANTFNVKNSIQLSDSLSLNKYNKDVCLASNDSSSHNIYLDGNDKNYFLGSDGSAYFNSVDCDILSFDGVDNFSIVNADDRTFTIQFNYNGKTYRFTPSESDINVS